MRQVTIAILLVVAIALQSAMRAIWHPLGFLDLTLILVIYFALQREPLQALIVAAVAGLAADLISGAPAVFGGRGFFERDCRVRRFFFSFPRVVGTTPFWNSVPARARPRG